MKKILTASLVAMMAVTAARADIASTKYVDDADKVITDTIGTVETGKTVVQMISEAVTGGSTGALADAKAYTDTEVGKVNTALTDYKTANDTAVASKAAQTALDAEVARATAAEQANAEAIAGLDTKYVSEEEMTTFKSENTTAIATAKSGAEATAKSYTDTEIAKINAADGGILDLAKEYADGLAANYDAAGSAAQALTDANAYTDAEVKELADGAVKANTDAINGLDTNYVSEAEMTTFKTDNTAAIAAAQTAADTAQGEVDALEGVVSGKQPKSEKLSLGAADGAWVDLTSATANYQTTGTYSLTLVNGTPYWTEVK